MKYLWEQCPFETNQKDQSVCRFIDILLKFLDVNEYVNMCSKDTFLSFLSKNPMIVTEESVNRLMDNILQCIKQLLVPCEEYVIWIKDYKLFCTLNIERYNTLSKIYQEYSVSHSPLFETETLDGKFVEELLYMKFELQYWVTKDISEIVIHTLKIIKAC